MYVIHAHLYRESFCPYDMAGNITTFIDIDNLYTFSLACTHKHADTHTYRTRKKKNNWGVDGVKWFSVFNAFNGGL